MQKTIIIIGVAIVLVGLAWPWLSKIPFGRLPGDIALKGDNSSFYFPITTMILISVILSLVLGWWRK